MRNLSLFIVSFLFSWNAIGQGSTQEYSVGVKMVMDQPFDVSEALAAKASTNDIVVLYNGSNERWMNQVRLGASMAKDKGAKVRGMIIGVSDPNFKESKETFILYYMGISVCKRGNADFYRVEELVDKIITHVQADLIDSDDPLRRNN